MKKNQQVESNVEEITFGCEIETTLPISAPVHVGAYHCGTRVVFGPSFNDQSWTAERDGSIHGNPGTKACEFVSPVLKGEAGLKHLVEFVAWLNTIGAQVNSSCGFHVHVGVASFAVNGSTADFVNQVARLVTLNATALYAQTGTPSRENGTYCQKPGAGYRNAVKRIARSGDLSAVDSISRYHLLNVTTVESKGTVEFRCFAGTLNIDKILLHVFSAIACCRIAATRKSLPAWEGSPLNGQDSLTNFLKVRPMWAIVSAQTFADHKRAMLNKGFEMAAKYDAARNGNAVS